MEVEHWIGESVMIYPYNAVRLDMGVGAIVGIMGIYCKVKFLSRKGVITTWEGKLEYVHNVTPQDWNKNVSIWERRSK